MTDPWTITSLRSVKGLAFDEVFAQISSPASFIDLGALERRFASQYPRAVPIRAVVFATNAEAAVFGGALPYIVVLPQYGTIQQTTVEMQAIAPTHTTSVKWLERGSLGCAFEAEVEGRPLRRLFGALPAESLTAADTPVWELFDRIEQALGRAGLAPEHITRTWFFLGNIRVDYSTLNAVRDEFFDRWGLARLPASTGIGAQLPRSGVISALVEAASYDGAPIAEPYESAGGLQCPPTTYGSRFVRANHIRVNGIETLNISGISSIDAAGVSLVPEDPYDAVAFTMLSFRDLLSTPTGMSPADIVSSYVYCKSPAVADAFDRYLSDHDFAFPHIRNFVDVCRPELVFEIEARASRAINGSSAHSGA